MPAGHLCRIKAPTVFFPTLSLIGGLNVVTADSYEWIEGCDNLKSTFLHSGLETTRRHILRAGSAAMANSAVAVLNRLANDNTIRTAGEAIAGSSEAFLLNASDTPTWF